jgi:hypothetical protein
MGRAYRPYPRAVLRTSQENASNLRLLAVQAGFELKAPFHQISRRACGLFRAIQANPCHQRICSPMIRPKTSPMAETWPRGEGLIANAALADDLRPRFLAVRSSIRERIPPLGADGEIGGRPAFVRVGFPPDAPGEDAMRAKSSPTNIATALAAIASAFWLGCCAVGGFRRSRGAHSNLLRDCDTDSSERACLQRDAPVAQRHRNHAHGLRK